MVKKSAGAVEWAEKARKSKKVGSVMCGEIHFLLTYGCVKPNHKKMIYLQSNMTTVVSVIIACTVHNHIRSGCIPKELLQQKVEMCYYE